MKKTSVIAALTLACRAAMAQVPEHYQVAPWKGFSECAITYSFDDLTSNQLPVAVPILDKYDVKASFNIVVNWVKPDDWANLKTIAEHGHEIASHTISHPDLTSLTIEKFEEEQSLSKKTLQEKTGAEVVTMVYPYCKTSHEDITEKYYIAARVCDERIEPHTPGQMMKISSKGVGPMFNFNSSSEFNAWVDKGAEAKGWCTFLIHGIDNDGGYSPIKSEDLDGHLKYVTSNPKKFWPATFAQISKYIMERNALKITESSSKKTITIDTECKAKSELTALDQPVTISRELPEGWKTACVKFKGQKIDSKIENNKIIFDIVPGNSYGISRK